MSTDLYKLLVDRLLNKVREFYKDRWTRHRYLHLLVYAISVLDLCITTLKTKKDRFTAASSIWRHKYRVK